MEKRRGRWGRWRVGGKVVGLFNVCALIALIELSVIASYCQCRVRHSRHFGDSDVWGESERKVVISKKRSISDGGYESTCSAFSNCEELLNSKCSAFENQDESMIEGQLKSKLGSKSQDFWCSCEQFSCSIIYKVDKGRSRVKHVFVRGLADEKANIIVNAEYFSDPGAVFQLARLQGEYPSKAVLSDVEFNYERETEFLDVAMVNITMELNGGFSVIENLTIVLQDRPKRNLIKKEKTGTHVLDTRGDAEKSEWFDTDCAFGENVEDFWAYGCQVNAETNDVSTTTGFWYPCQEKECSIHFDGTKTQGIVDAYVEGYFQDGELTLYGKSQLVDDWYFIEQVEFNSSLVHNYTFDIRRFPGVKVLQLSLISDKGGVIVLDKLQVDVGPKEGRTSIQSNVSSSSPKHGLTNTTSTTTTTTRTITRLSSGSSLYYQDCFATFISIFVLYAYYCTLS